MCNIPFSYNNMSQNFCVFKNGQFVCEVDQINNYDACNLGEKFNHQAKITETLSY